MPYCTVNELKAIETEQLIMDLTDDTETGEIDTTHVTRAVTDADALIDSYLAGRVSALPLSPVPPIIAKISCEITIYNLYLRRYGGRIPEGIRERFTWAESKLKDIIAGKILVLPVEEVPGIGTISVSKSNDEVFSTSILGRY